MLEYRVREGENNASKKPAIILIHGYGSHADDLFAFTPYLPKNHTVIALQAPLELAFNRVWAAPTVITPGRCHPGRGTGRS